MGSHTKQVSKNSPFRWTQKNIYIFCFAKYVPLFGSFYCWLCIFWNSL